MFSTYFKYIVHLVEALASLAAAAFWLKVATSMTISGSVSWGPDARALRLAAALTAVVLLLLAIDGLASLVFG